ncbi:MULTISPECIES: hypothetical protein [unclassified Nocardiopsis]|uniref:hypothetical protein n=1 Tax=unclassified Nocardiopsis TaxID=2649073 RepID=UPI00135B3037|nr:MULTISPECIES: hypothetical protein [unclassified Nocardiopsis]
MSYVGLENVNSLATGGEQLGQESDNIRTQVNQLLQDLSSSGNSLQGEALARFQEAQEELSNRFEELMTWCGQNGIKLNEGQQEFTRTDANSSDQFSAAGNDLGAMSRPVNA